MPDPQGAQKGFLPNHREDRIVGVYVNTVAPELIAASSVRNAPSRVDPTANVCPTGCGVHG